MRKQYTTYPVIKAGTLVFFDSLSAGLIPAKVRKVWKSDQGHMCIDAVATATRNWCKRGDTLCNATQNAHRSFVPRNAVYRSRQACGQYRILPYQWQMET